MRTTSLLFIGVCHIATTLALEFTVSSTSFQVGESSTLTWSGSDDNQPVQIYLYKGNKLALNPSNALSELTSGTSGNSYVWTPDVSLVNGDDYSLEIIQGTQNNYLGGVSIKGSSATSSSASASASAYPTASSSAAKPSQAVVGAGSRKSNTTAPATTAASNSSASAVGTAASVGTGSAVSRNKTMSKATLSHKTATSTVSFTTGSASSSTPTESSSASSPAPTSKSGAIELASNFALVLAGFAAVVYLG